MKKMILVMISLLFVQLSYSQSDKTNRSAQIDELMKLVQPIPRSGVVKGVENSYTTDTISVLCTMVNEKVSSEIPNVDFEDPSYKVTLVNMDILNSILKKNLSRCMDFQKLEGGESLNMNFEISLSGRVNHVSFIYVYRLNIPVEVIEQIETDIRNQCKFDFDRNSPAIIHANYLRYMSTVYLKEACL